MTYNLRVLKGRFAVCRVPEGIAHFQVGNWKVAVEVDPSLHHSFPII